MQDTASECSLDDAEGLSREARSEVSSYLATRKKLTRGNPMTNLRDLDPVVRDFLAMQRLGQLFTNPRYVDEGLVKSLLFAYSVQALKWRM